VKQGSFTDIWTGLTASYITALVAGSYYLNIRTSAFTGGEIRGQITAVPEPGPLALAGLGAATVFGGAWLRRRRPRA
jgi:hypothetical protein